MKERSRPDKEISSDVCCLNGLESNVKEINRVALLSSLFYMHSVAQHEEEGPGSYTKAKKTGIHERIGLNKADREKNLV